jgi:hypothetical protein
MDMLSFALFQTVEIQDLEMEFDVEPMEKHTNTVEILLVIRKPIMDMNHVNRCTVPDISQMICPM